MDDATILTADQATHVKTVAIALAAVMVTALVGIDAQTNSDRSKTLAGMTSHIVPPDN